MNPAQMQRVKRERAAQAAMAKAKAVIAERKAQDADKPAATPATLASRFSGGHSINQAAAGLRR